MLFRCLCCVLITKGLLLRTVHGSLCTRACISGPSVAAGFVFNLYPVKPIGGGFHIFQRG